MIGLLLIREHFDEHPKLPPVDFYISLVLTFVHHWPRGFLRGTKVKKHSGPCSQFHLSCRLAGLSGRRVFFLAISYSTHAR